MTLPFSYFPSRCTIVRMSVRFFLPFHIAVVQILFSSAGTINISDIYADASVCLGSYYMELKVVI